MRHACKMRILALFILFILVAGAAVIIVLWRMKKADIKLMEDVTERGAEIRARLRELLARHEYTTDARTVLVIGAVDQALEHHEAICLLRERELTGAALAIIRLLYDAMFRALWIRAVATEEQVEQASREELNWLRIRIRDDIKRAYFGTPEDPKKAAKLDNLFDSLEQLWKVLCSYTHSGALQLSRRFTFDQVKPDYSPREIAEALNSATIGLLFCLHLLFRSMGAHNEAEETVTMLGRYNEEFSERLISQGRKAIHCYRRRKAKSFNLTTAALQRTENPRSNATVRRAR
jgi:uncharacterized protein DUF6988